MNTQYFSALIKMSLFASLLCLGLVLLGNYGLLSNMPIEVKDLTTNQTHIDYIHIIFYVVFNCMFVGFLGCLLWRAKHSQQQMKQYLAHN
ncbi:hypothetical protein PAQU9191_00535 [Photobacterium aquimaris]|uniref:Uncharacterized protein n=1 Tax=Photobacterium aquimaris TaxID=512643 RepID=A0A1Y6KTF9_9GAMM|nr:hypothetical protein PAQU9191_00535 [Photobacterium aquimaris]